jgi:hypothetical protein
MPLTLQLGKELKSFKTPLPKADRLQVIETAAIYTAKLRGCCEA